MEENDEKDLVESELDSNTKMPKMYTDVFRVLCKSAAPLNYDFWQPHSLYHGLLSRYVLHESSLNTLVKHNHQYAHFFFSTTRRRLFGREMFLFACV